jgi:tRNA isopentenyl-2-thiomethyl-A-37 hydroxylase MiaE
MVMVCLYTKVETVGFTDSLIIAVKLEVKNCLLMAAMLFYIPLKLRNFGRSVRRYNTKFQEYILTHGSHI